MTPYDSEFYLVTFFDVSPGVPRMVHERERFIIGSTDFRLPPREEIEAMARSQHSWVRVTVEEIVMCPDDSDECDEEWDDEHVFDQETLGVRHRELGCAVAWEWGER